MNSKILIIGNHPINANLTKQYLQRGDEVVALKSGEELDKTSIASFKEIVLLSDYDNSSFDADNQVLVVLQQIAANYTKGINNDKRLLCHLLLRSHSLLHLIRLNGFSKEIEDKLEVYPFTIEDQWCQTIAMGLDREPITKQSEKTVHLVVFGMSEVAEQVAINAAHICHYPNYLQEGHTLRTRITVIDEKASEKSREWIHRYKNLFDNCYYRFIETRKHSPLSNTSRPMYIDRGDFVDIEWEFVSGSSYDPLVRSKIAQWATCKSQLLTIVLADYDTGKTLTDALHLPETITSAAVPVYVYMQSDEAFKQINSSGYIPNIIPFGMLNHGYDVNIPVVKMAKNVNYIYDRCYQENDKDWNGHLRFSVEIDEEKRDELWSQRSGVKRMSNIYNAMTIGVKMHSMGFTEDDWDQLYEMSHEDIELLAEVEHNRWSVEELILGWRPCTDREQREVESDISLKEKYKKYKIHYDLRAYNDLRPDGTGRPVQVYDRCLSACIPLIAKESKGGSI